MAAGPTTRITDVVVPQVFTPYMQVLTEEKSRIIQSGIAARDPFVDDLLAGGGLTFNLPRWRDLDNDAERVATDDSVPFATADANVDTTAGVARPPDPRKIQTLTEIAVRLSRSQSWSAADLAADLAGSDPMMAIANRVAAYWARRLQLAFIRTWQGVIADNTANDAGDYTNNVSAAAFQAGVTNFTAEAFLDAAVTMGDSMEDLTTVFVHSIIFNRMQKNNLIDFIPDSEGRVNIPTFLGRQVIIDDGMPRNGHVYESWLFGSGTTRLGIGTPPVPTEMERQAGGGNGYGQDVLHSRVQWCLHPVGHAWIGPSTPQGGPANDGTANSDLNEAASWDRRYVERKQIKFARLITREA